MGLYAVAYGRQYDVSVWKENVDWKREMEARRCNSLHAHAGRNLLADEIVVYDEAAVVLNYIVEFKC